MLTQEAFGVSAEAGNHAYPEDSSPRRPRGFYLRGDSNFRVHATSNVILAPLVTSS